MTLINDILNIGVKSQDDINTVKLKRQVNGLNLFFTLIAFSVLIVSIVLFSFYGSIRKFNNSINKKFNCSWY